MFRMWEALTRPLLDALAPRTLVEVGAFAGDHTRLLLAWCRAHGASLHAVDPSPAFDPASLQAHAAARFTFHRATSLEVLPHIQDPDVVLLDGDHNWYTVFHELVVLAGEGRDFPVVLLHDVGWPYGRRDLYYDTARIPEEFLHPSGTGGLVPGRSELAATGLNAGLVHARHEGGPRNGVLTAVEDFVASSSLDLDLIVVPGLFGYGILCPRERRDAQGRFARLIDAIRPGPELQRHLETLEWWRVHADLGPGPTPPLTRA